MLEEEKNETQHVNGIPLLFPSSPLSLFLLLLSLVRFLACSLYPKGLPTAAFFVGIGVVKLEAPANEGILVVELEAKEVEHALRVHHTGELVVRIAFQMVFLSDLILLHDVEDVGHARAAAGTDPHAEVEVVDALLFAQVFEVGDGGVRDCDDTLGHFCLIASFFCGLVYSMRGMGVRVSGFDIYLKEGKG